MYTYLSIYLYGLGMLMYHLFQTGGGLLDQAKPTEVQAEATESLPATKRAADSQVSFTSILGLI